jgi:site-specific recombinase XerD
MPENIAHINLPYLREFLLNLQNNNYSKETVNNYARDLEIFAAFLFSGKQEFTAVNKLVISEYKGFLRSDNYLPILHRYRASFVTGENEESSQTVKPIVSSEKKKTMYRGQLSSRSVNRMLSTLRSYLMFLVDIDQPVPIAPSAIKLIKTEKKEKQVADLNELVTLIECPMQYERHPLDQTRNRAILELIFATGMRISEVTALNREQLKMQNGKIADDRIYVIGKGKKQRFVYLTPRAITFLEEYLNTREDNYPALFIPRKGTRIATENPYIVRLSQNYIQAKIADYRRRLGIIVPTSAHSLRHGFATYLAEEGASPAAIQKLLGHESLQTTTRYVHASDRFAETTHRKFHPLKDSDSKPALPEHAIPQPAALVSEEVTIAEE